MKRLLALLAVAAALGCADARKDDAGGTDPRPPLTKIQEGVVGYVVDTAGNAVANATVYLVPAAAIPQDPLALTTIANERTSTQDEPLEDAIRAGIDPGLSTTTNAAGAYAIATVPAGSYFLAVVPETEEEQLPGGDRCRTAMADTQLKNQQLDVELSTRPTAAATYVGPSACLTCHQGSAHVGHTLHANGIRATGAAAPSRFPEWNEALASFDATGGTTLTFYGYDGTNWKVAPVDPDTTTSVSFTARLWKDGTTYKVTLTDRKHVVGNFVTYDAELSYGGGLHKQRWITKAANGSRYVLPLQYNFQGSSDLNDNYQRWKWQHYNAQNWFNESATPLGLKLPSADKTFDNACAGCHFTGYSVAGNKADAVADPNGDYDYDGDGSKEVLNISCETCHGPGSAHVAAGGRGVAIVTPNLLTPEREVTICSWCHTRFDGFASFKGEAPLSAALKMPTPGASRPEFLQNHVQTMKDGLHGSGPFARQHHQQASDFLKTKKYRNQSRLLTCTECHDIHGESTQPRQIRTVLDSTGATYTAAGTAGLCLSCHTGTGGTGTVGQRMAAHWNSQGVKSNTGGTISSMGDVRCVDCHMPKTAKSGSGTKEKSWGAAASDQYWWGDISSHLFEVPLVRDFATRTGGSSGLMAVPYTHGCGFCHATAPTAWTYSP